MPAMKTTNICRFATSIKLAQLFRIQKMTSIEVQQAALANVGISDKMISLRRLTLYAEADQTLLVSIAKNDDGREYQLLPEAADAWLEMKAAAEQGGVQLIVQSAYRSVARQIELIQHKLSNGVNIGDILQSLAPPGYSEHHTGRAIDIASAAYPRLDAGFADTDDYAWLIAHAGTFGFTLSYPLGNTSGYVFEPWHWCWHKI